LPNFPWTVIVIDILTENNLDFQFYEAKIEVAWVLLALQAPFWFMVHLYLENIIPNSYGISKSCCFCFRSCCKPEATEEEEIFELPDLESNLDQAGKNKRH
jgi:hypothetical protein